MDLATREICCSRYTQGHNSYLALFECMSCRIPVVGLTCSFQTGSGGEAEYAFRGLFWGVVFL